MAKYMINFSKEGTICYTSHLDLLRLFHRGFKRAKVPLLHTKGFHPHPKMSFAQPLALGYSSLCEYLEFETEKPFVPENIREVLEKQMPNGIRIFDCQQRQEKEKTLAAQTKAAEYILSIPVESPLKKAPLELCRDFLAQQKVIVLKQKKKTNRDVEINIRDKIQDLHFSLADKILKVTAVLDSGSSSNLSPEMLITGIKEFCEITTPRYDIEVLRTKIFFG